MQELAKVCGVPYKRLLIALRGEEGELNGRFHFHCLVGGTATRNYHTLQHQAEWLWKLQTGGARVDVRQYDRSLAGAEYVCKCLGANAYELNKYSFANTVTLSASVTDTVFMRDDQQRFLMLLGQLPARLTAEQAAWVLNCQAHDIPALVAARLLKPLGNPPPNGVKFFATAEVLEQVRDRNWLVRVSSTIYQHWHKKNELKRNRLVEANSSGSVSVAESRQPAVV